MDVVYIDLKELPTAPGGQKYLLVFSDDFSHITIAEPVSKKDTVSILQALVRIMARVSE